MSDIKTINADEAYQMVKENKCNLIDIRELNELELTGKVEGVLKPYTYGKFRSFYFLLDPNSDVLKMVKLIKIKKLFGKFCDPNSDVFKNGQIDKDLVLSGGEMSVKSLTEKGFKNISHIEGGFGSISNSSFKIV